ncbi:MAG TPA: hypothetical protein VHO06_16830 [Polyangia bacterium]|nr:hypothetical protein [Polyangia bacterium]
MAFLLFLSVPVVRLQFSAFCVDPLIGSTGRNVEVQSTAAQPLARMFTAASQRRNLRRISARGAAPKTRMARPPSVTTSGRVARRQMADAS